MAYSSNYSTSPLRISKKSYDKANTKMRAKHKTETGRTLGDRKKTGTSPRRVSFACRFGSMQGNMKDKDGSPSKLARALSEWGFGSKEAARKFCQKHKKKK
jgi:hypothetical protein